MAKLLASPLTGPRVQLRVLPYFPNFPQLPSFTDSPPVKKWEVLKIRRPSREFRRRMFERFTEEAMKAVMLSEKEKRRVGHMSVGADKILVGLLLGAETIPAKVLESMGVKPEEVWLEADRISGRPTEGVFLDRDAARKGEITAMDVPFTDPALHTLELSYEEARKLGHNYIGSGHVLLGLVSNEGCLAALVLANLGANASNIRAEVTRMMMVGENNNETVLEMNSYQPSVEDVAEVDEAIKELGKKRSQVHEEMTEAYKRQDIQKGLHLFTQKAGLGREINALAAKRKILSMWC